MAPGRPSQRGPVITTEEAPGPRRPPAVAEATAATQPIKRRSDRWFKERCWMVAKKSLLISCKGARLINQQFTFHLRNEEQNKAFVVYSQWRS
jgi:hypothetical protein